MAPWPEQGTEPKAPDKGEKRDLVVVVSKTESEEPAETALAAKGEQITRQPEEKEVLTLDEGQLKALLDEAITYKNPKDREGKSELFKELLQEAEEDESDTKRLGSSLTGKLPRGYYNLPAKRRHSRHQGRECGVGVSTTRGGSLQNLHALGMEGSRGGGRSRRNGRSGETLVSARQREGGSLPTNVNVDNDADLDSIISHKYTSRATLEVSETRREDSLHLDDLTLMPHYQRPTPIPNGTVADTVPFQPGSGYSTVRSVVGLDPTKEYDDVENIQYASSICVGPAESGAVIYSSNQAVQHVSLLSIPPSQIQVASDATTRMVTFGKDSSDSKTKSLDENGNALGCLRMDSNCLDRKKQRRVKTKNDQNFIYAEQIEGFRGGSDIDEIMRYIESTTIDGTKASKTRANQTNGPRNHVKIRAKEEESRTIKRRGKEKLQRCNSLEEISKTKLEDLTEESSTERVNGSGSSLRKKRGTLDDVQLGKKSSWDNESGIQKHTVVERSKDNKVDRVSPDGIQDSEFHVVTKKQRKKKKRPVCSNQVVSKPVYYAAKGFPAHDRTLDRDGSSSLLYQYRHGRSDQSGSQPRRKSASSVPPSDKSDSSDLDSVHSLPVSSTTTRTKIGKNSVSGGSTPQASYADIARTMASPPDVSSQGKCSPYLPDLEMSSCDPIPNVMLPAPLTPTLVKKDAMTDTTCDTIPALPNEEYPPLEVKTADMFIDNTVKLTRSASRDNNISEDKVSLKTVPNDNFVIPVSESGDVPQSLCLDTPSSCVKSISNSKRPPVILMDEPMVNSHIPTELTFGFEVNQQLLQCDESMCNPNNVLSPSTISSLPSPARDASLNRLIQFVNAGWEDTMKDLHSGRASYYNGQ